MKIAIIENLKYSSNYYDKICFCTNEYFYSQLADKTLGNRIYYMTFNNSRLVDCAYNYYSKLNNSILFFFIISYFKIRKAIIEALKGFINN